MRREPRRSKGHTDNSRNAQAAALTATGLSTGHSAQAAALAQRAGGSTGLSNRRSAQTAALAATGLSTGHSAQATAQAAALATARRPQHRPQHWPQRAGHSCRKQELVSTQFNMIGR